MGSEDTRIYVDVNARFSKLGQLTPSSLIWKNGHVYEISEITKVCRTAGLQERGIAMRYTCIIDGRELYLFYGLNNRWFVEGKSR